MAECGVCQEHHGEGNDPAATRELQLRKVLSFGLEGGAPLTPAMTYKGAMLWTA